MKNFANTIEYRQYVEKFEYIFDEQYYIDFKIIQISDCYKVKVKNYNHEYKVSKNYGYSISCQEITLLDSKENMLFHTILVFGKPFFDYVKHSNGNEYFICGNDLLNYTIYNISKNKSFNFVSEDVVNDYYDGDCDNEFWYITKWIYNPGSNMVAINGQDGMNCSTVTLCDFSEPDALPLKFENLSFHSKFRDLCGETHIYALEWTTDGSLVLFVNEEKSQELILDKQLIENIMIN